MRRVRRFGALGWMQVIVAVALVGPACGSDPKKDAATAGASSTADAGDSTDAGSTPDAGSYGACTDVSPANPAPELAGRWAIRTVASRYVPATGLTSAFTTRTLSTLLAEVTQSSVHVSVSAQYCEQHAEDPEALAHVVIPESYVSSLKPFVREGSYAEESEQVEVLLLPSFVEVVGAELDNPAEDPLPTEADDEKVEDQDEDGNPGVTIKLSGLVSGDLYVVQRQVSELIGIAVSRDRIEGRYGFTTEQTVLESNPSTLKPLAAQTAIADPNVCASTFVMVRVDSTATCADLVANEALFE